MPTMDPSKAYNYDIERRIEEVEHKQAVAGGHEEDAEPGIAR